MANTTLTQTGAQVQAILDKADKLPSSLGTAGQVLTMNSGATAAEWQTPSGGSSVGISDIYTLRSPQTYGIAFNAVDLDNDPTKKFLPVLDFQDGRANIKCCMVVITSFGSLTLSNIIGDLYGYDGVKITTSNFNSYLGKLLILRSNVEIQGSY